LRSMLCITQQLWVSIEWKVWSRKRIGYYYWWSARSNIITKWHSDTLFEDKKRFHSTGFEIWVVLRWLTSTKFFYLCHYCSASIVPIISFGENELYKRRTFFGLIPNGVPWGQFILGLLPLRHPVITIGKHLSYLLIGKIVKR